ncbi:MAG: RICIN domain-containing protein [Halococcoides sp.]
MESTSNTEGESTSKSTGEMARREYLRAVGVAGALGVSASFGSAAALSVEDDTYRNPLFGPDFADPTIHRADDGTWWAYASNMGYTDPANEMLVPIVSSPDLANWTYEGEAFDSQPGWTEGSIWAPDIHYHDGQWVMFYSLWPSDRENEGDLTGIGLATSDTPDGPFTDHGKLFTNTIHPYPGNTIDPYFVYYEGTPYLFWGNFAGVYYVELTADLQAYRDGTWGQIGGSAYEGSTIFERNGYWYYFGSSGDCCSGFESTYEIEVARSEDGLLGPYYDSEGTPLIERNEWRAGPTYLDDNDRFIAPGHGDVTVADDGTYWFVYHAYDSQGPEYAGQYGWPPARQFFIDRIYWTEDDWPVIGGDGTPSLTAPIPNLGQQSGPVKDGTYRVVNAQSGHSLAVESTDAGASAIVTTTDAGANVEWTVTRLSGGEYIIENEASGLVLEVADADTSDGADIQQWHRNNHPTQRWNLIDNGDGTYRLWDACGNAVGGRQVAEVANASESAGANVQQWTDNGGTHQHWEFVPVGGTQTPTPADPPAVTPVEMNGTYRVANVNSGQVLSVENASTGREASVVQRPDEGAPDQQWTVEHLGDGIHRIENVASGLSLDVLNAQVGDGANVIQWPWNGQDNQRFLVGETDTGDLVMVAQHSNRVVEVASASTASGANVQQWTYNGGDNQHWAFEAVDEGPPTLGEAEPTDPDGDGLYEDVSGDGKVNFPDVNLLFQNSDTAAVRDNAQFFDFESGDGINLQDVMALFRMV